MGESVKERQPLITVGLPCFNNEKTIEIAITSIVRQTYTKWELIVMDDGSKDKSLSIIKKFKDDRIRIVHDNRNIGISARLNQAMELGSGKYFARMDGDDVAFPERFERQVAYLEEHSEIDLLGAGVIVFKGDGCATGMHPIETSHAKICKRPWAGFHLVHPTWMGRRTWFLSNQYRSEADGAEDQDLLLRTYITSQFACLPDILLGYRQESLSLKKILKRRCILSKAMTHYGISTKCYTIVGRAIAEQILKGLIDILAIGSGLGYNILRHRSLPMSEDLVQQWKYVWKETNFKKNEY